MLVALGAGLLIGLERERRKGAGPDRAAAGVRTFTVAALGGALAQLSGEPAIVIVGALLVAALAALAYLRSASADPGLTTELALFATYLVGVQSVVSPAFGAACGAGLAALLAARTRLHRLATQWLSEQELHDGLLLAALALIVLPLVPDTPIEWIGGINPRPIAALVVLILGLQAAGHVARRWSGPRRGVAIAGFFSGFVSSTATIATLGRRARAEPLLRGSLAAGAALSAAATWVQVLLMSVAVSPGAARALAVPALAGLAAALLAGGMCGWAARREGADGAAIGDDTRALRPREALVVAALLAAVTLAIGYAQRRFGAQGMYTAAAVAGLADAHSPVASLAALFAGGQLPAADLRAAVLVAITANTATRMTVGIVSGGVAFAAPVAAALAAGLAAAWASLAI